MIDFTVTGSRLHEAASWAARVVPGRPAIPLLGGLVLDASEDQLAISAFDYETAVTAAVPAVVGEPGRVLLSARLLTAVAKAVARDVDVHVEVDGSSAVLRCGRSRWSAPTMDAADYPGLPTLGDAVGEVDAETLRRALARVLPVRHAGSESALQNLTGVKLSARGERLTLVATDRWRLAVAEIDWKPAEGAELDALVPGELLEMAACAPGSGTVALFGGPSTFGLSTDTHRVVGRLIAQSYPDIARFMPAPAEHRAIIDVAELSRALDEAMVVMDGNQPAVTLAFSPDSVEVAAAGGDQSSRAGARLHALHGEPIEVVLNAGYLRTALRALESDTAVLCFAERSVLALPCDGDGVVVEGYVHLVMRRTGLARSR